MNPIIPSPGIDRRALLSTLALLPALSGTLLPTSAQAQSDPLPSWNDGPAKQAIDGFVQTTTTQGNPQFVPLAERIATFDNDGTLWVEQPMYVQLAFALDRVKALAHPGRIRRARTGGGAYGDPRRHDQRVLENCDGLARRRA